MFENYQIKTFKSIFDYTPIKTFVAKHHYLGASMPRGCNKVFCLFVDNILKAVAMVGEPTSRNARMCYGQNTLELRRFVLAPEYNGTNTGSWFMSKCLKQLQDYNILTYSDNNSGHTGGLYRASNFRHVGQQRQGSTRFMFQGSPIFAQSDLGKSYAGELQTVYLPKKDIWIYESKTNPTFVPKVVREIMPRNKEVLCLETGMIFSSIEAAAEETGFNRKTISGHCNFKVKKTRFEFLGE